MAIVSFSSFMGKRGVESKKIPSQQQGREGIFCQYCAFLGAAA